MTYGDRGTGAISTALSVTVFLLLMLAAVQILFDLHATSMVTAAATDAATEVAGYDAFDRRCAAADVAAAGFRATLGDYARRGTASIDIDCDDPNVVRARVIADHPSILPHRLRGLLGLGHVDRTIEVRVEGPG